MSFNPDPSKQAVQVIFSRKLTTHVHPKIYFNNNEVTITCEYKHLGLILDSKLSFESHINEKIKIARKGIGIIKYLSNYLPFSPLDQIYKMYIRPHLDFCDVIYHIPKMSDVSVPSVLTTLWTLLKKSYIRQLLPLLVHGRVRIWTRSMSN